MPDRPIRHEAGSDPKTSQVGYRPSTSWVGSHPKTSQVGTDLRAVRTADMALSEASPYPRSSPPRMPSLVPKARHE